MNFAAEINSCCKSSFVSLYQPQGVALSELIKFIGFLTKKN